MAAGDAVGRYRGSVGRSKDPSGLLISVIRSSGDDELGKQQVNFAEWIFANDLAFGLFFVSKTPELRSQFVMESEEHGYEAVALIVAFEKLLLQGINSSYSDL